MSCSESTFRRRADRCNWVGRLAACGSGLLHEVPDARTKSDVGGCEHQRETFRQNQLTRIFTVGDRAEILLDMVERSARHYWEAGIILQGRELSSVTAAACMALEAAMNIAATALSVSELSNAHRLFRILNPRLRTIAFFTSNNMSSLRSYSALPQRKSISWVKSLESCGERISSSISSLV